MMALPGMAEAMVASRAIAAQQVACASDTTFVNLPLVELAKLPPDQAARVVQQINDITSAQGPHAQVALFCYGDHNRRPFLHFLHNIVPDLHIGDGTPNTDGVTLMNMLWALVDKKAFAAIIAQAVEDEDDTWPVFDTLNTPPGIKSYEDAERWLTCLYQVFPELFKDTSFFNVLGTPKSPTIGAAIRFVYGGFKYILVETFARSDYRRLSNDILCANTDSLWTAVDAVLVQYCVKDSMKLTPGWYMSEKEEEEEERREKQKKQAQEAAVAKVEKEKEEAEQDKIQTVEAGVHVGSVRRRGDEETPGSEPSNEQHNDSPGGATAVAAAAAASDLVHPKRRKLEGGFDASGTLNPIAPDSVAIVAEATSASSPTHPQWPLNNACLCEISSYTDLLFCMRLSRPPNTSLYKALIGM